MKNIGLLIISLGALLLILSYFCGWTDNNALNLGALLLTIIGLVAHIVLSKKNVG